MNRLKFWLTMLCAFVSMGVWAQIKTDPTPDPSVGTHVYDNAGTVALAAGDYIALQCRDYNGGAGYFFTAYAAKTTSLQYENFYVLEEGDGGAFYMKRVKDDKYVGGTSSYVTATDKASAVQVTIAKPDAISGWNTYNSDTDPEKTLRVINASATSMFINTQPKTDRPTWAGGKGGYSIWYVWKFTKAEVDAMKPKEWVEKAQNIYSAVSVAAGCVGSYNATAAQIAALQAAIADNDDDACKTLVEAIGDRISFDNKTVYSVKNANTSQYLRAMDDNLLWAKAGVSFSESDARFQWMVYNDGTDNILYNIAQGGWANNTNTAANQHNHWQIVTDQNAMSYVEIVDAGTMFSFRDKDHAGIDKTYLHNNTSYNTGITNWDLAPGSTGSGWRLYPLKTLSDAVTASVATLQQYSANIKLIQPYIEIYNNLNMVGYKAATDAQKTELAGYIKDCNVTEAEALVATLGECVLSNSKKYTVYTKRGNLYTNGTVASASTTSSSEWAVLKYGETDHFYFYDVTNNKFLGTADLNSLDAPDNYYKVELWGTDPTEHKFTSMGTNKLLQMNGVPALVVNDSWSTKDDGDTWFIKEVGDFDATEAMALITAYESSEATVTVNHQYNGTTFKTTTEKLTKGSTEAASWQPAAITNRVGLVATLPAAQTITEDITVNVPYTYDATQLPFAVSDLSAGFKNGTKFYTLKIRGTKNVVYSATSNYAQNSTSEPGLNAAKYFAFTGDNVNGFKIYNLAAGTDKAFGTDNATGTFTTDGQLLWLENNSGKNIFHAVGTENKYVNDNGNKLAYWVSSAGATDDGGNITFAEADADDLLKSAKMTFIGATEHVTTSGLVGDYTKAYAEGVNEIADQVEALSTLEEVLAYSGPTPPAVEYILPEAGNFYAIRDHRYDNYVDGSSFNAGTPSAMKGKVNHTAKSGNLTAGQIWYFDENMKGYCFATGFGLKQATEKAGVSDAQVFTFELKQDKTDMPKTFAVRVPMNGVNAHWYIWDQENVNHGSVDRNGNNYSANNCQFYVEKIHSLPVTIGSSYYATVNLPVPTVIPAGVEAWVDEYEVGYMISLKKITDGILPANCPVILYAATPGTYDFVITEDAGTFSSIFSGTTAAIANPSNTMVLGKDGDGNVALYPYTGAYIPGFKMYYQGTASEVRLEFNATTTAIEAAKRADMREGEMYNINGQQVTKANGLVIVNGKKFVVK